MMDKEKQAKTQQNVDAPTDTNLIFTWLEGQPSELQANLTLTKVHELLDKSAQPRHVSGNACIDLCYFIEKCRASKFTSISEIAFAKDTGLKLFNFYLEWNEKNQNRSMRQVLELVSSLIAQNPDQAIALQMKNVICQRTMSIIFHQASEPLVKPAFKCIEYLLSKNTVLPADILVGYLSIADSNHPIRDTKEAWDVIVSGIFEWLPLPDVAPAAGKSLVTLLQKLRADLASLEGEGHDNVSWQRWIRGALIKDPTILENCKNYLLPGLFKLDRHGSLSFIESLSVDNSVLQLDEQEQDAQALLWLSSLEVGKKIGLVDEFDMLTLDRSKKKQKKTTLQENAFDSLLCHVHETVRSLAFSVLVVSSSPLRPFSNTVLAMLRNNLHVLHSETDAKVRNEVLSTSRNLVERLRGSTAFLTREMGNRESAPVDQVGSSPSQQDPTWNTTLIRTLLEDHENFIRWYCSFLVAELIPTASYQRHITALKAMHTFLNSGILFKDERWFGARPGNNETVWPYAVDFFSPNVVHILLDLLVDPFEDVRTCVTSILKLAQPHHFVAPPIGDLLSEEVATHEVLHKVDRHTGLITNSEYVRLSDASKRPLLGLLTNYLNEIEKMSNQSGRADYAEGVAHAYDLLYCIQPSFESQLNLLTRIVDNLEHKVCTAEQHLAGAVEDAPVHGDFATLNFIWTSSTAASNAFRSNLFIEEPEAVSNLQQRIFDLCARTWNTVKTILCDDSPEGHFPEELSEAEVIDTKDVLSYSFRAIHESSKLLQTFVSVASASSGRSHSTLPSHLFASIGSLTFEQLATLRHRGAFSTVAITFTTCCRLSSTRSKFVELDYNKLLEVWHEGVLHCIQTQPSTTRRSAGIPVLFTGIMAASSTEDFQRRIAGVMAIAKQKIDSTGVQQLQIPKVHAINCLREVFKNSSTGPKMDHYISESIEVVASCLKSEVWAINNSGLLLLRSIIDVLFGTNDSKSSLEAGWDGKSVKIQYDKYPALTSVIIDLLSRSCVLNENMDINKIARTVLPALSILRRAGPPPDTEGMIYAYVRQLLGNPSWHIREHAAQTLAVISPKKSFVSSIDWLLSTVPRDFNEHHGTILAIEALMNQKDGLVTGELAIICTNIKHLPDTFKKLELQNTILMMPFTQREWDDEFRAELVDYRDIFLTLQGRTVDVAISESAPYIAACFRQSLCLTMGQHNIQRQILDYCKTFDDEGLLVTVLDCQLRCWEKQDLSRDDIRHFLISYIESAERPDHPDLKRLIISRVRDLLTALQPRLNDLSDMKDLLIRMGKVISDLENDSTQVLTPSYIIARTFILAYIVLVRDFKYEQAPLGVESQQTILNWGLDLLDLTKDNEEYDSRFAAVNALLSFYRYIDFREIDTVKSLDFLLPSFQALYNGLNDDDEIIRNQSAAITSKILGPGSGRLSPVKESQMFVRWLHRHFASSELFACVVVSQLTGLEFDHAFAGRLILGQSPERYSEIFVTDLTLFVQEKNNLYTDLARELEQWKEVALKMTVNFNLVENAQDSPWMRLLEVASDGCTAFMDALTDHPDTALSWTSRPRCFEAALKYITCAEVALELFTRDKDLLRKAGEEKNNEGFRFHWYWKLCDLTENLEECRDLSHQIHPTLAAALKRQKGRRRECTVQ